MLICWTISGSMSFILRIIALSHDHFYNCGGQSSDSKFVRNLWSRASRLRIKCLGPWFFSRVQMKMTATTKEIRSSPIELFRVHLKLMVHVYVHIWCDTMNRVMNLASTMQFFSAYNYYTYRVNILIRMWVLGGPPSAY